MAPVTGRDPSPPPAPGGATTPSPRRRARPLTCPEALPTVLHADLDAFYASVEQLLEPSLRRRPVAVGAGVVLAASYEARSFGVSAGMSGWRARQLCPALRVVPGHFRQYQRIGARVMGVLDSFTPVVERVSIDEAFLDVAGSLHLFGSPADIAVAIRRRVRDEIGLPISVGAARTKHLAKVASQVAKPDGLVVVAPGDEASFLAPLPVELLWGVGPTTRARLADAGVCTVGELAASGPLLDRLLGPGAGSKLRALAADVDDRPVRAARPARSVGAQAALGRRRPTPELVGATLAYLADRVTGRLRAAGRAGRTVTVRVRFADLRSVTRSVTVRQAVSATLSVTEIATELVTATLADHPREGTVTLLSVSMSNLVSASSLQLELPFDDGGPPRAPGSPAGAARGVVDRSVDAVRQRFGPGAVGYARTVLGQRGGVPDGFRELAEHRLS